MWHLISMRVKYVCVPVVVHGRLPGSVRAFLLFGGKVRRNLQDLAAAPHCINEGEGAGEPAARGPQNFTDALKRYDRDRERERGKGRMREINFTGPEARERKCAKQLPNLHLPRILSPNPRCMEIRSRNERRS